MTRTPRRRLLGLIAAAISAAAVVVAAVVVAATAVPAHAEDGYRFWGYYQWKAGTWAFATTGPEAVVPADGSVEGWRFAVGGKQPRTPRAAGDFDQICAAAPAEPGKKRVALVIDAGTPQDAPGDTAPPAPKGVCVVAAPAATGAVVLSQAAQVRIEKGLTCAVDGYPASGCGDPVKNIQVPATDPAVQLEIVAPVGVAVPSPGRTDATGGSPAAADAGSDSWQPILGAGILVVLLAAGGYLVSRRRRTPSA